MERLAAFDSVEEFNRFIRKVRYLFADRLNGTDRELLDYMSRYAVKYIGVFGQKIATMGQALEKGSATVRRSLAKMEQLGILRRVPYIRPRKGGNGANLIVFNPGAVPESRPDPANDRPGDRPTDCPQLSARQHGETPEKKSISTQNNGRKNQNLYNQPDKVPVKEERPTYRDIHGQAPFHPGEAVMDAGYAGYNLPPSFARVLAPMGRSPRFVSFAWSKVRLAHRKSRLRPFFGLDTVLGKKSGCIRSCVGRSRPWGPPSSDRSATILEHCCTALCCTSLTTSRNRWRWRWNTFPGESDPRQYSPKVSLNALDCSNPHWVLFSSSVTSG